MVNSDSGCLKDAMRRFADDAIMTLLFLLFLLVIVQIQAIIAFQSYINGGQAENEAS